MDFSNIQGVVDEFEREFETELEELMHSVDLLVQNQEMEKTTDD